MAGIGHVWVDLDSHSRQQQIPIMITLASSSCHPTGLLSFSFLGFVFLESREGRTHPAVGAVRTAALLRRLVDLDVLDDQVARVEALGVGVGFGVLEQREEVLGRLDGPAGAGDAELLAWLGGRMLGLVRYDSS